jgi:hypothetical protein
VSEEGQDFVRITNREIWVTLNDVKAMVQDLERDKAEGIEERKDIRARLRALELKFYGVLAGLLGGIGMLAALLVKGGA